MNPRRVQSCCLSLLCLLVLGAPAVQGQDKANKVSKESVISNKKKRTYYAFVPANIKAPAPLIVLLHGSGHDGMSLLEPWKDLAGREGFIVVSCRQSFSARITKSRVWISLNGAAGCA